MDGRGAVTISPAFQIDSHAAVTVYPVMAMVDLPDLFQHFRFMGMVSRLPMFSVVVVGIGTDRQPTEQPAGAEFVVILLNEPISL